MYVLLILLLIIVVTTVSYGLVELHKQDVNLEHKVKKAMTINLSIFIPIVCAAIIMLIPDFARAATSVGAVDNNAGIGYIAAALSTGLAAIGAGYAVGTVGSSALGAVSEDPKILGKTLIYVGLSEGIAIYGLIISILILSKI